MTARSDSRVIPTGVADLPGAAVGTLDVDDATALNTPVNAGVSTRDFPLPSRALRLGLHGRDSSAVSTAEVPVLPEQPRATEITVDTPVVTSQPKTSATAGTAAASSASVAKTEARTVADRPEPPVPAGPRRAKHRSAVPPQSFRARTALVALAAGAATVAVTGSAGEKPADPQPAAANPAEPLLAAGHTDIGGGVAPGENHADMDGFTSQLTVGKSLTAERRAKENAARRPLFYAPITAAYSFTSGYGPRWGSHHGGLDFAAPLGTPIHSVTDGEVIEAGPASGYGNWIQVRADDGTVVMYGHMASSGVLVQKGQKVTAGDVIGLVGSEGFSTGPHLHIEVWENGTTKIDPAPWMAKNGIRIKSYTG